jgi:TonB family protein
MKLKTIPIFILLVLIVSPLILKSNPPGEVDQKDINKVDELLYTGQMDKALKLIHKLMKKDSTVADLYYFKAKALKQLEIEEGMQENLEYAVKWDSLHYQAILQLATLYYDQTMDYAQKNSEDSILVNLALKSQGLYERYLTTIHSKKGLKNLKQLYLLTNTDTTEVNQVDDVYLLQRNGNDTIGRIAEFPGGEKKMYEFIRNELIYPHAAKMRSIQGRVFATFIVERDGQITHIQILKGLGGGCSEEVIRIIKAMPKWIPGIAPNGEIVRSEYRMPFKFSLRYKNEL